MKTGGCLAYGIHTFALVSSTQSKFKLEFHNGDQRIEIYVFKKFWFSQCKVWLLTMQTTHLAEI